MKKFSLFCVLAALALIVFWQIFLNEEISWYIVVVIILILSMLPFLIKYEKKRWSARELTMTASLIAIAVSSRAVFYLIPQVKPIVAVVIVSAVCLGPFEGYMVGIFSAFLSNFIFGQGIWTPFQMVGLGMVGLIAGFVLNLKTLKAWKLAVCGFVLAAFLYGAIVDLSTVLVTVTEFSVSSVLAVYAAALPFDIALGISTAVFLFLFGLPFSKKIDRVNVKYGVFTEKQEENDG